MLFVLIFGVFCAILMLNKSYLSKKVCKCCFTRLDKIKECDIRRVNTIDTLQKLNETRKTIRSMRSIRKDKTNDDSLIELNDFVCKR
jgi:hypothetical protein